MFLVAAQGVNRFESHIYNLWAPLEQTGCHRELSGGRFLPVRQPFSGAPNKHLKHGGRRTVAGCASGCPRETKAKNYSFFHVVEAALQLKDMLNPPEQMLYFHYYSQAAVSQITFSIPGRWCRAADCSSHHSTSATCSSRAPGAASQPGAH